MADTNTTTKLCTKCGETKPATDFSRNARARDGLYAHCKSCAKTCNAAWYEANCEKKRAYSAAWRAANPDKVRETITKWRADNKERLSEYYTVYREANPEKRRINENNRRAKKRVAGGKLSNGLAEKLFKLQKGKCACCGRPLGDDYHLDHIMPLALGGANTDDNMQLLRAECNMQKHSKHPVDFMRQRGFLL